PRPDAQPLAGLDLVERRVFLRSVVAKPARGLRGEAEERLDRRSRSAARPEFQDLPEQNEGDDDRRRLEVDPDLATLAAERDREDPRRDPRDDTVDVGRPSAEGDQGEHVQAAVDERVPAADEERPAAPEDDRGGE